MFPPLAHRRAALAGLLLVTGLIWAGVLVGVRHSFPLSPANISHETEYGYVVWIPSEVHQMFLLRGDSDGAPRRSPLQLFEGDRPLGPAHSPHQDIRERGEGRYSHFGNLIYFSATDNSNPAANGRAYHVVTTARIPLWAGVTITIVAGLLWWARGRMPALDHHGLTLVVFGIFLLAIVAELPGLWAQAAGADAKLHHLIPATVGDDGAYQMLAVNLLNGLGYNNLPLLPGDRYRLDGPALQQTPAGVDTRAGQFRRSPGLSLMLAAAYKLAGPDTIVAQRMMAALTWLTALLLLMTGAAMAGWIGSIAGGVSALYHLHYFPGTYNFERLLSENPTAFWVALCVFTFTLFLKRAGTVTAICSATSLAALILMRVNFFPVLPLLVLYLIASRYDWRSVLVFAAVASLPLMLWSAYATVSMGRPVLITMAGPQLFANTNNLDTLEGVGADRWNQGGWNPGFYIKEDGTRDIDFHNQVKPDENGWLKGLVFWRDHIAQLPQLFYVKLRAGFWFADGKPTNWLRPDGLFLVGIGYLLIAVGFLPIAIRVPAWRLPPDWLLASQIVVLSTLFLLWNRHGLLPVMMVWAMLLVLSLLRLSAPHQPLPFSNPVWFLAFVASHALTTILFYGIRFHLPLDSSLMLFCFLGMLLTVYESARRGIVLPLCFISVVLLTAVVPISW